MAWQKGKLKCSRALGRSHRQLWSWQDPLEWLQIETRRPGLYTQTWIIHWICATIPSLFRGQDLGGVKVTLGDYGVGQGASLR